MTYETEEVAMTTLARGDTCKPYMGSAPCDIHRGSDATCVFAPIDHEADYFYACDDCCGHSGRKPSERMVAPPSERADLDAYAALVDQFRLRRHISLSQRADACDALLNELRVMRAEIDGLKLVLKQVIAQATERAAERAAEQSADPIAERERRARSA